MAADATSAWFALGGVLLAGAMGFGTAFLTQHWQGRAAKRALHWEHAKQLRQERRETYLHYWNAWNRLIRELEKPYLPKDAEEITAETIAIAEADWRQAVDALLLICSREVLKAGITHVEVTESRIAAALQGRRMDGGGKTRALNRAMRDDILKPTTPDSIDDTDPKKASVQSHSQAARTL
ncbi:hypothetical protein OHA77_33560 [Streptosporangium sp. NBC_01639]|uniref:hypothetical protein n=1 Tax=Streptosporangium sp. NBC_01639 TaxID=2975948 RepID=UPI00386E6209|nr:hypothetical protein OHA77_33560 [Streptosporangium sp. NBC_01639]